MSSEWCMIRVRRSTKDMINEQKGTLSANDYLVHVLSGRTGPVTIQTSKAIAAMKVGEELEIPMRPTKDGTNYFEIKYAIDYWQRKGRAYHYPDDGHSFLIKRLK